jgi:hypothetical protein
MYDDVP